MKPNSPAPKTGIIYAIAAAALFGVSTPFSKLLVGSIPPQLLAGLLYLGSGSGLLIWFWFRRIKSPAAPESPLHSTDLPWLAGAVLAGGVIGPILLMAGLAQTPASTVSLLLNLEGVFTALLAWFVFKENFDRRIFLGMAAITGGGVVASWPGGSEATLVWGALLVAGACLAWAIDNNLTRKIAAGDPVQIAAVKGLVAGTFNLSVAVSQGAHLPSLTVSLLAGMIGFLGYGVSLTFFILALRHIGTARTGAYFSLAPFLGAGVSLVLFRELPTPSLLAAALLMAVGVWLHVTEHHEHEHWHDVLEHDHLHTHDDHHDHHEPGGRSEEPHSHRHTHQPQLHSHPHYPDLHHRHDHSPK